MMAITEQNINEYIEKTGQKAGEHTSIWAVKMPSVINMALFGSMATLFDMQYNILNVSERGIMLIGVDGSGKLSPKHVWMEKESIQKIQIKKGMISYNIQIETVYGCLKYRVNKVMLGSGFQKDNVDNARKVLETLQNAI